MKRKKKGVSAGEVRLRGTLENLGYWLKLLYRESPWLVWLYLSGCGVSIGISWLEIYMPSVLVGDITAGGGAYGILRDLAILGGGLVILHLLQEWMEWTRYLVATRVGHRQALQLIGRALDAEYRNIERADFEVEFGTLLQRHHWEQEYTKGFLGAAASVVTAVAGIALYAGMLSRLTLWILLLVVAGTAVTFYAGICGNRWDASHRHLWMELDNQMSYLSRYTSKYEVAKDVHLYEMAPWLQGEHDKKLKQRLKYTVHMQLNYFLQAAADGLMQLFREGAAYLYLIWLVCDGRLDAAGFVFYFGIVTGFASWCKSIVSGVQALHQQASYVEEERCFEDRMKKDASEDKEELVLAEGHVPEIVFEDVTFCYSGADVPTLKNLNLTLKPGENVALVGLNGAGKTTFIKLLCGFYDPTQGRILIDGKDRSRYSRESWLKAFSGVFQDAEVFPLSLRDNLAMGQEIEESRLWESLKMADLEERVSKLPKGMDTLFCRDIYEDAVDFSGGEEQKLMLARAFCRHAPVLVLDEPTAALDPLVESELYERYHSFSEGRTTVFISHRLASTRFCDRVVLMEEGDAAEIGSHQELLDKGGKYAGMFWLQSRYYQKKEAQKEAGLEGDEVREDG